MSSYQTEKYNLDGIILKGNNSSEQISQNLTGIVKENYNKEHFGEVLVELFDGISGASKSDWLRVMQPCNGMYFMPDVGMEVIVSRVAGERNDFVVMGCLYNNNDGKCPQDFVKEDNTLQGIENKKGQKILLDSTNDKESICVKSKKELTISLDDEKSIIRLSDKDKKSYVEIDAGNGSIIIAADRKISLIAGGKEMMTFDGNAGRALISADSIEIKASQSLKLNGQSLNAEGGIVELKGSGNLKIESGAMLMMNGKMVKIN